MIAVGSARTGVCWSSHRRLISRTNLCPQHPQDLVAHNCINMRQATGGGLYAWEFEKDGQELRVRVAGQLTFNTSYPMVDAAVKVSVWPTSRTIWLLLNFQQARSSPSLRTGRHPFRAITSTTRAATRTHPPSG